MKAGLALLAVLLAGCGRDGDEGGAASANQIARLARSGEQKQDPLASVRLQPVSGEDMAREGLTGAGCAFGREGRILLAVVGSDAIVRIGGELRHLAHSAPAGPSGGFFEDRHLSISVGRTGESGTGTSETRHWPARIAATNRRTGAQLEAEGVWACGA